MDSQHFHDNNGGIYACPSLADAREYEYVGLRSGVFIAVIESLGRHVQEEVYEYMFEAAYIRHQKRLEKAYIIGVKAFLSFFGKELREGCLIRDKRNQGILLPAKENVHNTRSRYRFRIKESGEVLFSQFNGKKKYDNR